MRDSLKDRANAPASGGSRPFEPTVLESPESRELIQKSVLYLSALLTFGGFNQAINRGEPHLSMWISLSLTFVALVMAWRVPTSSRHLIPTLHTLMAVMVLNICIQVVHGASALLVWTLPFYLIWIMLLPTVLVAVAGVAVSLVTTYLADNHPVVPANYMLALASALVVHFGKEQVKRQLQLASSDPLTGALNRRYLLTQLASMRAEFVRAERISSLVLMDVDGLKAINDSYGHKVGDAVLESLATIVRERVRGSDALFRIGGDEFVLILCDAKASSALKVANDVRQLIREQAPQELPDFAISFGICCVDDSSSADDWLERADEALYEAKKLGGDAARMAT